MRKKKPEKAGRKPRVAREAGKNRSVLKTPKPKEASRTPLNVNSTAPPLKEGFRIAIEGINADTILGDLIVVFPRTREVLKKYGLNLDVEEAGDIYMNLEAFAVLRGLRTSSLLEELETASKEVPQQPSIAPVIAAPIQ